MKLSRYVCLLAALSAQAENLQLASFDQVWKTVRERHWDKEKTGAAWDRARTELRPEAEKAETAREVRPVIQKLLAKLGQSHFGLIPAEAYATLADGKPDTVARPSFDFRILSDEAVVTRGADGIKTGWTILRIGREDVGGLIQKVKDAVQENREAKLFGYSVLQRRMSGAGGQMISITFGTDEEDDNHSVTKEVPLVAPAHLVKFGNFPQFGMEIESKRVEGALQYFRFNVFFEPDWLQAEMGAAVRGCGNCEGFILDLRGNLGGIVGLTSSIAAWFVGEQRPLGTMISRTGDLKLTVIPRSRRFEGKLAVLVDSLSVSSAEFLAAGLKDLGRARLFGEQTQGAALPSVIEELPNGDRFQFAIAGYVSAAGAAVEGSGVMPHVVVRPNRIDYLAGRDPALDAAREWIHKKE